MKIAVVVITLNDDYKFDQWLAFHDEYKTEIYKHIIVDNGSNEEYLSKLESNFPESIIIKRQSNLGTTKAYNDGIKLALSDNDVDSVMLLANDIKIPKGGLTKLYSILYNSDALMISPILLDKDSMVISDFGSKIGKNLHMIPYMNGQILDQSLKKAERYVEALTGGVNLAKREFYNTVGYQDEKLFMYSDEVDMGIRANKKGIKLICTNQVLSWHQHINPPNRKNRRPPYTAYLIGRNKVYIARKHFNSMKVIYVFFSQFKMSAIGMIKGLLNFNGENIIFYWSMLKGSINGLFNKMRFSPPNLSKKQEVLK
ncbi:MAG TPA: glycosyltransferase [Acholeplasmataceae bacterium]|nr:glycosyltransferase [Acholeplasmataceae bacterium]